MKRRGTPEADLQRAVVQALRIALGDAGAVGRIDQTDAIREIPAVAQQQVRQSAGLGTGRSITGSLRVHVRRLPQDCRHINTLKKPITKSILAPSRRDFGEQAPEYSAFPGIDGHDGR